MSKATKMALESLVRLEANVTIMHRHGVHKGKLSAGAFEHGTFRSDVYHCENSRSYVEFKPRDVKAIVGRDIYLS